ncbi:MoaD/ThiS family protein [bacterium]|nr:MoaD/ThiS family protein [bacterium]
MTIEVRLFAGLDKGRFKRSALDVPDGATLADLLRQLGIPEEKAKVRLVNGKHSEPEHTLHPDDTVALFPLVAGG